jgi:putative membrane protein
VRPALLAAGGAALGAALLVPDEPLSAHMVGHLLLTMVAAPLIAAGGPVRALLRVLGPAGRRRVGRALASRPVRALCQPLVAGALFVAATLATHLGPVFDAAERHAPVHVLEHGLLVGSALLLWALVLGADPLPHRPGWVGCALLILGTMPAMSVVGIVLADSDHVLYAAYAGTGALADQHRAGEIMWLGSSLAGAVLFLAAAWQALAAEQARARAREARA